MRMLSFQPLLDQCGVYFQQTLGDRFGSTETSVEQAAAFSKEKSLHLYLAEFLELLDEDCVVVTERGVAR